MNESKQSSKSSGGSQVQKSNRGSVVYGGSSSGQTRHTNKTTSSAPVGNPPGHKK